MTSRQVFSPNEINCLKELVVKYKLNKSSSLTFASQSVKKLAWRQLTEDFNSIGINTKRTEAQLKKCYDNLKTRQKISFMTKARCRCRRRLRTVQEAYNPNEPQRDATTDPLQTDPGYNLTPEDVSSIIDSASIIASPDTIKEEVLVNLIDEIPPHPETPTPPQRVSPLCQTTSRSPLQGSINVPSKVIEEELRLKKIAQEKKERREEELHNIIMKEKELVVMAAEETYFKVKVERDAAEELLRCRRAERKLAEYELKRQSKNDEI